MPIPRLLAALFVLLLVPSALAGSEAEPELSDPEGDQEADAFGASVDVLSAWIETSGDGTVEAVVKLASASQETGFMVDLVWHGVGWLESEKPITYGGVRVVAPGPDDEPRFSTLASDDGTPGSYTPRNQVEGSIEFGQPTYVRWNVDYLGQRTVHSLRSFSVESRVISAVTFSPFLEPAPTVSDTGAQDSLVAVRSSAMVWGPDLFKVPDRKPDRTRTGDTDAAGVIDLQALWLDIDDQYLNMTMQVRSLEEPRLQGCDRWHGYLRVNDERRGGFEHLDTQFYIDVMDDISYPHEPASTYRRDDASATWPVRILMQPGEPGLVRAEIQNMGWQASQTPSSLEYRAGLTCRDDAGSSLTLQIDRQQSSNEGAFWLYLLGFLGATGAAVAVAVGFHNRWLGK